MIAPPIPTMTLAEEGIYGEVSFSKKTSVRKKKDDTKPMEEDEDENPAPPPVPPRTYSQEILTEYRENESKKLSNLPNQSPNEQQKVNLTFDDDDPDAIYASIEVEPTYLTAAEVGITRPGSPPVLLDAKDETIITGSPPMLPPFPLDTPVTDVLPPYHSPTLLQDDHSLPAAASLADISNGVLGPKGEIIPLPTRKNSKGNLLDIFTHVFSHEEGEGEKKKEKLPISLVNPLYDFEADYSASAGAEQPIDNQSIIADSVISVGEPEPIAVYELDDEEREEQAYKNLVQHKTIEDTLKKP